MGTAASPAVSPALWLPVAPGTRPQGGTQARSPAFGGACLSGVAGTLRTSPWMGSGSPQRDVVPATRLAGVAAGTGKAPRALGESEQ